MGKRLFVSVDLDGLEAEVAAVQNLFAGVSGLTRTDPEQAHVTLQFLGETDPDRMNAVIAALERAVEAAGVDPFGAEFGGLGVFPSLDYISVVWLGVRNGDAELTRLHEAIEPRLVDLGFDEEAHEFTPHVTLARMNHAGGKERVQTLVRERDPTVGTTVVSEIRLTESQLTADGPTYSTVARVDL